MNVTKSLNTRGHSSRVEMALDLDGVEYSIAQMGPDYIILEKPGEHAPAEGEIRLDIDGTKRNWMVYLPKGLPQKQTRIPILKIK